MTSTIDKNVEKIIREEFGFKTMKIDITEEEVNKQKENYESKIEFTKALQLCLESFLNDGSKLESPLALVKEFYPTEVNALLVWLWQLSKLDVSTKHYIYSITLIMRTTAAEYLLN